MGIPSLCKASPCLLTRIKYSSEICLSDVSECNITKDICVCYTIIYSRASDRKIGKISRRVLNARESNIMVQVQDGLHTIGIGIYRVGGLSQLLFTVKVMAGEQ